MTQKFIFTGTGGSLLIKFLVGLLLSILTLGIYLPWFIADLTSYVYENLTLQTPRGNVQFKFTGKGGSLFKICLTGTLLTLITLGIYTPWFVVNSSRFFIENSSAANPDGSVYQGTFTATGIGMLSVYLVGIILISLTLGLYTPWFIVNISKFYAENIIITKNNSVAGTFNFNGTGAELLGTYIIGTILIYITLGIYGAWFDVSIRKFLTKGISLEFEENKFDFDFIGTGGNYFIISIIGYLLTALTLGIYGSWFLCSLLKFKFNNTIIKTH